VVVVTLSAVACNATDRRDASNSSAEKATTSMSIEAQHSLLPPELGLRAAHTATTLGDGSVFVAGGCVADRCPSATTSTVLVAADGRSATAGPALNEARDAHTSTLLTDGRVVLVGGFGGEGQPPRGSVELFDPKTGVLTTTTPLAIGRGGHAAARTQDDRVVVIGGWTRPRTYTSSVEVIARGEVAVAADLPWSADSLDAIALVDGRILVTGGQTSPGVGTARAAVFDPMSGSWQEVGGMGTPRFKHTSALLPDGSVLVLGGTTDDFDLLATTEVFDPQTGTFSDGPPMTEARYKTAGGALTLSDGRVAIAGGGRTVEIIDPADGTTEVVSQFAERGSFATLNLLGSGDLLVIGGYDDNVRLRGTARTIRLG
jgi:hypothetical protein